MLNQTNQVMGKTPSLIVVLLAVFMGTACRGTNDKGAWEEKDQAESSTKVGLSVEPIDQASLKRLIGERSGKILLLNIWATWCEPCVAEFPDLTKLSQTYDTAAVKVVAISADYPDEVDTKIIPFVRKTNVPFRVYVAQFEHQEDFINAVNRSWSGALPVSLIYDSRGKERFFHVGQQSFDDFKREVEKVKGGLWTHRK
ncbi:MAG: TlpA disulfide reductase family protein [Ignavibacteriales bacterium]|nr:TlpA disulfide reductase family protein [Ignavibacteriales bacterium]